MVLSLIWWRNNSATFKALICLHYFSSLHEIYGSVSVVLKCCLQIPECPWDPSRRFWKIKTVFIIVVRHFDLPWWLRWWRICLQCQRPRFDPWVGKVLWRRTWLPTLVLVPGESPWTEESWGLQSVGSQSGTWLSG